LAATTRRFARFNQETPQPQWVAPADVPLKSEYREKPLRVPSFLVDVLGFTFLGWLLATVFLIGAVGLPLLAAAGWAALPAWAMLLWRGRQFDDQAVDVQEREWQELLPRELIRPEVQEVNGDGAATGHIKRGQLAHTPAEWRRLALAILPAGRVTREVLAPAAVIKSLTKSYGDWYAEAARLGWIDSDGKLTGTGREWFRRFADPPTGPVTPSSSSSSTPSR
jgi:hypothetical protein